MVERPVAVTVVTVALNAAPALPLTLESVIGQDHADRQIVVVDGASWDDTGAVLRRYASAVDRVVVAEDAGIYHAMNAALTHATGDYVLFMNAGDQFYRADAISRMVSALEDDPDIFYGNHVYVDRGLEVFKRALPFEVLAEQLATGRIDGNWLDRIPCHQATFVRTDLLRRLRFDTRLRVSADHDLLFRAHASGARMQYVDEIVCHYFGGGFSVAAGERTRLEGATIYRRFSDRPDLVDRVFFPAGSPLPAQTRRTGVKLGGFLPTEGWADAIHVAQGLDWVAGDGAELLTPEHETGGLELSGYCELDDQHVSFFAGEEEIGRSVVPRDFFRLEVPFARAGPPATVIRMRPHRVHVVGDRQKVSVGFAVRAFRFADARAGFEPGIAPGEAVAFESGSRDQFRSLLGQGWSEPETTHMWSLGEVSELWVKAAPEAMRLHVDVSGNPHVPGGNQHLRVSVNGETAGETAIDRGGRATVTLDCTRTCWRKGAINRIVLRPSAFAVPPAATNDTRPLGFCIYRLGVE